MVTLKEIVEKTKEVALFCGYNVLSIKSKKKDHLLIIELQSKGRIRKKLITIGVSNSLNGILAAERLFASQISKKKKFLVLDITNSLPSSSFEGITLVHTFEDLQNELSSK